MPFERKLLTPHRTFIASQVAEFTDSPAKIKAMLNDPAKGEEYGFEPVDINEMYLGRLINHNEEIKDLVVTFQVKYLIDFSRIPLAHKKQRVLELVKLYDKIDKMQTKDGNPLSESVRFDKKRMILAQIAGETDETVGRLADAIAKNADASMSLHDKLLGYFKEPLDEIGIDDAQAAVH